MAKKPYNPIIGETFRCSWRVPLEEQESVMGPTAGVSNGDPESSLDMIQLVYCAEQVSHHPPGVWALGPDSSRQGRRTVSLPCLLS